MLFRRSTVALKSRWSPRGGEYHRGGSPQSHALTCCVRSVASVELLDRQLRQAGAASPLDVHLEVDTEAAAHVPAGQAPFSGSGGCGIRTREGC
jgi:hypothetical protein